MKYLKVSVWKGICEFVRLKLWLPKKHTNENEKKNVQKDAWSKGTKCLKQ